MITNNELNAVTLSATKKDFYQIWNELLEVTGKISNRWNPAHANESDPGVVLLKVLTALADKLNYNIDVNTLEAFMPTAAQEESMRNLCEMMGYNMKYYQSAITEITMNFIGSKQTFTDNEISNLNLPMFSSISSAEKDVNYVTLEDKNFSTDLTSQTIQCIEGQHVLCETINNNVVTIDLLDDNNRFYLPEAQIAENGIFVYSIKDGIKSSKWEKKTNLHIERLGNKVFKFGYDSKEARPYLQFPEDISQIIGDGLEVHYIRTSGNAGNIAALTLTTFELPSDDNWKKFTANDFTIYNLSAAQNGTNIETITDAYENYKKTVGTFDTLVTCRDYMNKIYTLMENDNIPMVSNIIVSDIRSDINRALVLCSFNDFGICYKEQAIKENSEALIDHFDLILYPFKTIYGNNNELEYVNSFKLYKDNGLSIERELENNKTIAHKIKYPENDEIVAIKNYLKLDAKITTTEKVNAAEEVIILDTIKKEIYTKFNMRKMEFGEEIPFDSILDTIEYAHPKIKNVVLNEPVLYTKFLLADGTEHDLASVVINDSGVKFLGKELYNKLALRNVLAGRLELFNYNTNFKYSLNESKYTVTDSNNYSSSYQTVYPTGLTGSTNIKNITKIEPKFNLPVQVSEEGTVRFGKNANSASANYQLNTNQEIKFRLPNFTTDITYPAYVNYYLVLDQSQLLSKEATAAEFYTIAAFMNQTSAEGNYWDTFIKYLNDNCTTYLTKTKTDGGQGLFKEISANYINDTEGNDTKKTYTELLAIYGAVWERTGPQDGCYKYSRATTDGTDLADRTNKKYYYLPIDKDSFIVWKNWLGSLSPATVYPDLKDTNFKFDLYRNLGANASRQVGYLVDSGLNKYQSCNVFHSFTNYLIDYYVPKVLGVDATLGSIKKNTEYQLKQNEYLFINYTPSKTTTAEDGTQTTSEGDPINIIYGPGSLIKPNFELSDSNTIKNYTTKRWSKTTGIDFSTAEKHGIFTDSSSVPTALEGMFGLSSDEQIEHRNMVYVALTKPYFIYWTFKGGSDGTARVNEELSTSGKYTLQEGEYLFITGASEGSPKVDMSYYGSGTELDLRNLSDSREEYFFNENIDNSVALDEILANGIAGIPWQYKNFNTNEQYLIIKEYQYVTLSDGDILTNLVLEDTSKTSLTKDWGRVEQVNYLSNGEAKSLSNVNINEKLLMDAIEADLGISNSLSSIEEDEKMLWEMKTVLHFKTDSNNCIELGENETLTLFDEVNTLANEVELSAVANAQGEIVPLKIQSNKEINSTQDSISTISYTYDDYGNKDAVYDFQIKVGKSNPFGVSIVEAGDKEKTLYNQSVSYIDSSLIKLHDFGDNLTSLHFSDFANRYCYLDLNFNLPTNCYGLLMIYYAGDIVNSESDGYDHAHLYSQDPECNLAIFNNQIATEAGMVDSWWANKYSTEDGYTKAYLKPGINVIKIEADKVKNLRLYGDEDLRGTVIISDLDAVYTNDDINLNIIDYQLNGEWEDITFLDDTSLANKFASEIIVFNVNTKKATYYQNGIPTKTIEGLKLKENKFNSSDESGIYKFYSRRVDDKSIKDYKSLARTQLLYDLNKLDPNHEFYYNCIINNSVALNINPELADTDEAEKLSTPKIWYDANNINNKFVISEIDVNWLNNKNGIMIARSSKR